MGLLKYERIEEVKHLLEIQNTYKKVDEGRMKKRIIYWV